MRCAKRIQMPTSSTMPRTSLGLSLVDDSSRPLMKARMSSFPAHIRHLRDRRGGMVLTNDASIAERVARGVYPLLMSNHHLNRLPALAGTFIEWMECGAAQADAIVTNAKALGQALAERGVPILGAELGFTESHTLILIVDKYGGRRCARKPSGSVSYYRGCRGIVAGGRNIWIAYGGSRGHPVGHDPKGCSRHRRVYCRSTLRWDT